MKNTLFGRFLFRYAMISMVSLIILALLALGFFRYFELSQEAAYLRVRTQMTAELIEAVLQQQTPMQEMNRQLRAIGNNEGLNVYLLQTTGNADETDDQDDQSSGRSGMKGLMTRQNRGIRELFSENIWMEDEISDLISGEKISELAETADEPTIVSVSTAFWQIPTLICVQKTNAGLLLLYRSPTWTSQAVSSRMPVVYVILLLAFLLVGLISLAVMAGMYRRMLKPFHDITRVADAIIAGQYDQRIADYPEAELQTLAESVNRMVSKLSQLESSRLDFTAQLAHELRTPLTILRMTLQGFRDGVIPQEEMPEFYQTALHETQRLEVLTQDLIDLAIAESDEFPLELQTVDISKLIESVVSEIKPLCQSRQQMFSADYPAGIQGMLDEKRIRQVLLNLLSNSSKFSGEGKMIRMDARIQGGLLKVTVWDNGPGIAEEEQKVLFEKYRRWGQKAGAGLGLAISRAIIEAHGGRIEVKSDGRTYSQFNWWIPV